LTVRILPNIVELVLQAAEAIATAAELAVQDRGVFNWAVAGGQTPRQLYQLLSQPPWLEGFPWDKTHLYFGDERCVPFENEDSNYRMLKETLLDKVAIPADQVYRVPVAMDPPESIAQRYEDMMRARFQGTPQNNLLEDGFPIFDLILLGLGNDGHTASIFPQNREVVEEKRKWAVAAFAPQGTPPGYRVTITLPVINAARHVMFLVAGEAKKEILPEILQPQKSGESTYPAGMIKPAGKLTWFLDQAAGSLLQ
jgi:6-phosphogluconolactonase